MLGDITDLDVDAIVNPANTQLKMGGALSLAIKKKGGAEIEKEAFEKAPFNLGAAVITAAGKLKARYIIHVATMKMPARRQAGNFKTDQHIIRKAIVKALDLGRKNKIKTIAIPALGCGTGRFPIADAAKIISEEVISHVFQGTSIQRIIFVLHSKKDYEIFKPTFEGHCGYILRKLSNIPIATVDAIIEFKDGEIVLIERKNPPFGWALPGGFVELNESLEDTLTREVAEETGLKVLSMKQFHTYSAPGRDPRFQTITTVYIVKATGSPFADSDAKSLKIFKLDSLPPKESFAFDHWQIINEWLKTKR